MLTYLLRRLLYAIPVLFGVNLLTFLLFFTLNSPDDIARAQLGRKYVTSEAIQQWKIQHGYEKPLFLNPQVTGTAQLTKTLFFQKSLKLFLFDFGTSDQGRQIAHDIQERMWPSLALALPVLIIGVLTNISCAMLLTFFRQTYLDTLGVVLCIILMSISGLFYIIGGQYLFAKILLLVPISGYAGGWQAIKFVILPVLIGAAEGLGVGTRWYRSIFLEEREKEYVRTARAKGLSEWQVLYRHVLKNALLPILTGIVAIIPMLFLGSLIMESFFAIPGLGSYTIDAIQQQDFAIVRAMVFLGSVLFMFGLLLTDFSYTIVDPRVNFSHR